MYFAKPIFQLQDKSLEFNLCPGTISTTHPADLKSTYLGIALSQVNQRKCDLYN